MAQDQEGRAPNPPSKKALLLWSLGAAVAAVLIVFGAVLPAEFNRDPLGLGRATGLSRLWAPPEVELAAAAGNQPLARSYTTAFRTDEIVIPLASGDVDDRTNQLEYKVRMEKGATLVYSWVAEGVAEPEAFYYDFHGHTLVPEGSNEEMTVSTYKQATDNKANGALVAPFNGIHGWYLVNAAVPPARVRLRLAGFYKLVAPGEEGNLGGITPLGATPPQAR
jgi:hypothetical protein